MQTRGRHIALLGIALLLAACAAAPYRQAGGLWSTARQLVLVITPDWDTSSGTLHTYARDASAWRSESAPIPVVVGRNGAAWGVGLHPAQTDGPIKHEGDGRSPAGVFAIGTAFGYAPVEDLALPYRALTAEDYCVDVNVSPLYNRIVSTRDVGVAAVAGSTEPMRRDLHANGDDAYKIGFVIEHNAQGTPGAGSCIFAHLWKTPATATSGCTAMTESALRGVLHWLQPGQHPIFVLLPEREYQRLRKPWHLPDIADVHS